MKNFFSILLISGLFAINLKAQVVTGKELKPLIENNKSAFGVVMAYDDDFVFLFTMSLRGSELVSGEYKSLSYRLFDKKNQIFISEWIDIERRPNAVYLSGNYAIQFENVQKDRVNYLAKNLKNMVLLLSVNQSLNAAMTTHYVDFSGLCSAYPGNFTDLTTGNNGCN